MGYREIAQRCALTLDYLGNYLDAGIVIDWQKPQTLLSNFNKVQVIGFDGVSTAEWEDVPFSGEDEVATVSDTRDFNYPCLGIDCTESRAL
jgi:hypothetical protein